MAISVSMMTANGMLGETFTSKLGNSYTSGANGIIQNVQSLDIDDLVKFGCYRFPQAGSGTGALPPAGNLFGAGYGATANEPSATNADYVLAVLPIPASAFDGLGQNTSRGVVLHALGGWAATTNVKRCKLWYNPTAAVVGSTVNGGTLIGDTASATGSGIGWELKAEVWKTGAAGSNTQVGVVTEQTTTAAGAAVRLAGPLALVFPTATESGTILVAVTGNAPTATSDINLNVFTATFFD
jgi:hypothetical protein